MKIVSNKMLKSGVLAFQIVSLSAIADDVVGVPMGVRTFKEDWNDGKSDDPVVKTDKLELLGITVPTDVQLDEKGFDKQRLPIAKVRTVDGKTKEIKLRRLPVPVAESLILLLEARGHVRFIDADFLAPSNKDLHFSYVGYANDEISDGGLNNFLLGLDKDFAKNVEHDIKIAKSIKSRVKQEKSDLLTIEEKRQLLEAERIFISQKSERPTTPVKPSPTEPKVSH